MSSTETALVPAGIALPAVAGMSGVPGVRWPRPTMLDLTGRRLEERYYRRILQAPSIASFRRRLVLYQPQYLVESRLFYLLLMRGLAKSVGTTVGRQGLLTGLNEMYERQSGAIARADVDSETKASWDYVCYSMSRIAALTFGNPEKLAALSPRKRDLPAAIFSAVRFDLLGVSVMLAADEPTLIRSSRVLREIIRRAVLAVDHHLGVLGRLGIAE